jgi:dihydrofolate reductase/thymidylate synthase
MQKQKPVELVVAMNRNRGIGYKGDLPWPRLAKDMTRFREHTTNNDTPGLLNAVVMGRKTWDSLPIAVQPLPNRINVIITSNKDAVSWKKNGAKEIHEGNTVIFVNSYEDAIKWADSSDKIAKISVIGGLLPFQSALSSPRTTTIHLTEVLNAKNQCDVFLPYLSSDFILNADDVSEIVMDGENLDIPTQYLTYQRKTIHPQNEHQKIVINPSLKPLLPPELSGEQGYLDLMRYTINYGQECKDRTGVGTRSLFGQHVRYNLRNNSFPLFTTKRVFFRGVLIELLWFIKGSTNSNELSSQKVHIWDGNSSREFLDKRGLTHRAVGDLGPVYGFQWRHFGADYIDFNADYTGKGHDQLTELVKMLKTEPDSRRLIISAWNPPALDDMALPPCHVLSQFRVYTNTQGEQELSCFLYQRSCDMALGVPFNVASYSLLTYMLAHLCGMKCGDLVHCMGDVHVYLNHIEPLQEQFNRIPMEQPTLRIARPVGENNGENIHDEERSENVDLPATINTIDDFVYSDFIVEGYSPYPTIKMDMAV